MQVIIHEMRTLVIMYLNTLSLPFLLLTFLVLLPQRATPADDLQHYELSFILRFLGHAGF